MIRYVYHLVFPPHNAKDHKPVSQLSRIIRPVMALTLLIVIFFFIFGNFENDHFDQSGAVLKKNIQRLANGEFSVESLRKSNLMRSKPDSISESIKQENLQVIPEEISANEANNAINEEKLVENDPCLFTIPSVDRGPHIVPPPEGPVVLVCCKTTVGVLNIAVHPSWAPIGVENFLNMVTSKFFSSEVALFRAIDNFLIQFGLAGDVQVQRQYEHDKSGGDPYLNLPDDPQWLPQGPPGRNIDGVPRFQKGYLSYAGGGPNTRGTQLFITNVDSLYLGGGSPWEVPLGQLVGEESYQTLDRIYTGYGEAPEQGKIRNRGNSYLKKEFPNLDYILSCDITATNLPWRYEKPK